MRRSTQGVALPLSYQPVAVEREIEVGTYDEKREIRVADDGQPTVFSGDVRVSTRTGTKMGAEQPDTD
jgi:hypothetical protein